MENFYLEALRAIRALPKPELCSDVFEFQGQYCTLGAVMRARGLSTEPYPEEDDLIEEACFRLDISYELAEEIARENDRLLDSPEARYLRMEEWLDERVL